ncbi:MAG: hypothetical protein H0W69_09145 [Gemmatimonadaceae bacterium]|nr:hypothetical protein [Gemmatimonadaceae bacterium]
MRSFLFAVTLLPATASVALSQQSQSLVPTSQLTAQSPSAYVAGSPASNLRPVDAPIGMTRAQAGVDAVKANNAASASAAAAVDPGTRNMLAIVGAVVVIIALVAFLL